MERKESLQHNQHIAIIDLEIQFRNKMHVLARRVGIRREILEKTSCLDVLYPMFLEVIGIKQKPRSHRLNSEEKEKIERSAAHFDALIEQMLREPVIPMSKKIQEVATDVYHKFVADRFEDGAVVVFGSNAHGGIRIREALSQITGIPITAGGHNNTDFDWGIVSNDVTQDSQIQTRHDIMIESCAEIPEIAAKYGLNPYHFVVCGKHNPANNECIATNLANTEDAKALLKKGLWKTILIYFQPSIPEEINERNSELILQGLRELYTENSHEWQVAVDGLIKEWKGIHFIKRKHLSASFIHKIFPFIRKVSKRDSDLANQVELLSRELISLPFERLILSTASTKEQ